MGHPAGAHWKWTPVGRSHHLLRGDAFIGTIGGFLMPGKKKEGKHQCGKCGFLAKNDFGLKVHMRKHSKKPARKKKYPTADQVEVIMNEWYNHTIEEFAEDLDLDKGVVQTTVRYLRKLRRVSNVKPIPAFICPRKDNIKDVVRCVGAKHGLVLKE
jgi:hypothetical protein